MMYHQYQDGYIEVITGCMFAGKTEELIRRINVLKFANKNILVFKPTIDNRYSTDSVVSHAGSSVKSIDIECSVDILDYIKEDTDVVAIDEVQFLDEEIVQVCDHLAQLGIRVMVAGLDMDFRGEAFGVIPKLMTTAEFVTKLTAVCTECGGPATRTQRLVDGEPAAYDDPTIFVGASESYEARCRHHHVVKKKPGLNGIKNKGDV